MESTPKKILVSSCLLGLNTRYNGVCKKNQEVIDFLTGNNWAIIPVCPEQLAGLPTPRPATCFKQGDGAEVLDGSGTVINSNNENMNTLFIQGAEQTLLIAKINNCNMALMKERSPSCGVHEIYLESDIVAGQGVTTALLKRSGLSVFSEQDLDDIPTALTEEP